MGKEKENKDVKKNKQKNNSNKDTKAKNKCIECGGELVTTEVSTVCSACGLIVSSKVYCQPSFQAIESAKSYGSVYASTGDPTVDGERLGSCVGITVIGYTLILKGTYLVGKPRTKSTG
jgi:hypothetical protein